MGDEFKKVQILLEQLKSDVKGVAEGVTTLDQKMDRRFDELKEDLGGRIDIVESVVRAHSKDLKEIKQDLKEHIRPSVPPAHVSV